MSCLFTGVVGLRADDTPVHCYESEKYFVVNYGWEGDTISVKRKSSADDNFPCEYSLAKDDFRIDVSPAGGVIEINRDLLLVGQAGGPGAQGLLIWDLKQAKQVYSTGYYKPLVTLPDFLEYWVVTGPANSENCPNLSEWKAAKSGGVFVTKVRLSLIDFKTTKSTETRCQHVQ